MEIDLFLDIDICDFGACGAVLFAEIAISFLATKKGRSFVLISKIAGLIFEIAGLMAAISQAEKSSDYVFLLVLFIWERCYLPVYVINLIGNCFEGFLNCKRGCLFQLPEAYEKYAEVKSKLYEEPKETRFMTLTEDGMKRGLATLYYGSIFNTTDYLGAVWKSDSTKYGCFFFAYFCSIMVISWLGLLVIIFSLIMADEEMWKKVIIGISLYMNALGAFQHWINLSHGIYERCLLRNEIRKESTVTHIQSSNSEITKTKTPKSQDTEIAPPQSQNTEIAPPQPLSNGWSAKTDRNGRIYYQNEITKQTQWEYPISEEEVNKVIELEVNIDKTTDKSIKSKKQKRKSSAVVSDTRRARMAKTIAYKSQRLVWKKRCRCGFYWCCCLWLFCGISDCQNWCCSVINRGGRRRGCCCKYFGNMLGLIVLLLHFGCISYGISLGGTK
eukprot:19834_1